MREEEIIQKLETQERRMEEIYASVEKTRKYILWQVIINVVMIVLPLGAILAIIPWFLSKITSMYQGI